MKRSGLEVVGLSVGIVALLAFAARREFHSAPPQRAFYYWKTVWSGSPELIGSLSKNHIARLYMRFFDVEWDETQLEPRPVSPLRFNSKTPEGVEVVPVIYIANAVFLKMSYKDVEALADHALEKVNGMAEAQGLDFRQLQLDCDWSDNSRRNYFHFVDLLARKLKNHHQIVSATIRLHQIKYADRTGIPPVNRGMLMFYNFGRIQADSSDSSIFNPKDAARYASYISRYPLTLDLVLPAFSWTVHSRDGQVLGLIENVPEQDIAAFDGFRKVSANKYSATRSCFFRGRYFMNGDTLLMETTTPDVTKQAAALAKHGAGWSRNYETVALFDLDEQRLKKYSEADIESILEEF